MLMGHLLRFGFLKKNSCAWGIQYNMYADYNNSPEPAVTDYNNNNEKTSKDILFIILMCSLHR
jgi:hypothetical protein